MATIAFKFENQTALRLANCITKDIEVIEKKLTGGVSTNWQKFERPFKAHYANYLVNRHASQLGEIEALLPHAEQKAREYSSNPNKRGRPLTTFINIDGDVPVVQSRMEQKRAQHATTENENENQEPENELENAVAEILENNSSVNTPSNPAIPQTEAMRNLMQALGALMPKQGANVDVALVRKIAKQEIAQAFAPTVITIEHKAEDGATTQTEMGAQHKHFTDLLKLAQIRGADGYVFPIWLPGPAGSGKTTAARNVAKALGLPFHHTGAVDNVYQLIGFRDAGGAVHRTPFREAYEHGGVYLWDEVDASNPNALVAFNAALENGVAVFPDGEIERHKDCVMIAAANTYGTGATHEYVGRNKIDAATLDRFIILDWPYDEILERAIAGDNDWTNYVQRVRAAVKQAGIKHLVTPRASIRGNALLAQGMDRNQVINMTVRKGLADEHWQVITRHI